MHCVSCLCSQTSTITTIIIIIGIIGIIILPSKIKEAFLHIDSLNREYVCPQRDELSLCLCGRLLLVVAALSRLVYGWQSFLV